MEGEKSTIINAGHDEGKFCSGNPADMMYNAALILFVNGDLKYPKLGAAEPVIIEFYDLQLVGVRKLGDRIGSETRLYIR